MPLCMCLILSHVQLCDSMDCSPPGSPVPGILQARTLEWVAISFSNAWKWKVKIESEITQSCPTLSDPMDISLPGSSIHGIFQARVLEWVAIAFSILSYKILLLPPEIWLHRKHTAEWYSKWSSKFQIEFLWMALLCSH